MYRRPPSGTLRLPATTLGLALPYSASLNLGKTVRSRNRKRGFPADSDQARDTNAPLAIRHPARPRTASPAFLALGKVAKAPRSCSHQQGIVRPRTLTNAKRPLHGVNQSRRGFATPNSRYSIQPGVGRHPLSEASRAGNNPPAMLHINDLTYRIGARLLLDHATVALPEGAKTGLVGRNGAARPRCSASSPARSRRRPARSRAAERPRSARSRRKRPAGRES